MASLLGEVLAYCGAHPHDGPLPDPLPITFTRLDDGAIAVEGDIPDVIAVSVPLIEDADPRYLGFRDGALVLDVQPGPLRYEPLGPDEYELAFVFRRIREQG